MTVKKCVKGILTTVEVCGGVCEVAKKPICEGCGYCRIGEDEANKFKELFDKEHPIEVDQVVEREKREFYRNRFNDEARSEVLE